MRQDYVERLSAHMRLGTRYYDPRFPDWVRYTDPDALDIACGQSAWILGQLTGSLLGDAFAQAADTQDEFRLSCYEVGTPDAGHGASGVSG